MLLYDKQSENDSDVNDITEYNHISIRMYNFSLNKYKIYYNYKYIKYKYKYSHL